MILQKSAFQSCTSATYHLTQILQNISKDSPILPIKTIFVRFDNDRQNHAFFIGNSCMKIPNLFTEITLFPDSKIFSPQKWHFHKGSVHFQLTLSHITVNVSAAAKFLLSAALISRAPSMVAGAESQLSS